MSLCPEKAELWTSGEHERTEGFSPSGVCASACRTMAVQSCGCRQRAGTRRRTSNKGTTQRQGKGAHAAMSAAAPASDRLGSMAGSRARRVCTAARCGTAGDIQTASSQGSVQPRLEGRADNKVEGVEAHLGSWTRRRRSRGGAEEEDWGSACCRGSRAARRHLQQVRLLFRGGYLTTDSSGLGVGVRGSGCSGFAAAHARADGDENMRLRPPPRMALPQ
jgi:hypothetical protein